METKTVITIGRQYGSAGRQIGRALAEELGIKCYDKELLDRAAKDSGMCQELFENHDEKPTNSFLYSLVMDTYSFGYSSSAFSDMPINQKVFLAQFETIKKIASEGPCIISGGAPITRWQILTTVSVSLFTPAWRPGSAELRSCMISQMQRPRIRSRKRTKSVPATTTTIPVKSGAMWIPTISALTAERWELTEPLN